MTKQRLWVTKILCFFVFFLTVILIHPVEKVSAKTTYVTMTVGETRTFYPSNDDSDYRTRTVRNGGGWINYGAQYYQILSDTSSKYSCQIKALKATTSPVILRLDYYYLRANGTYTYQAAGYVDYQITITNPSGGSGSGNSGSGGSGSGNSGSSNSGSSNSGSGTTGHATIWEDYRLIKANTCTESGQMMQKCKYCSKTRYITLPKKGHQLQKIEAKAATTSATGNIEYWKCSTCGACFKDSAGKEEITESSTVLAKLAPPSSPAPSNNSPSADNLQYKVTNSGANGTVIVTGPTNSGSTLTTLTIGNTVTINGTSYKITAIAAGAFKNCQKLKTVTIGNNVTSIGQNSFAGCTSLTKVTLGSGIKKISKKAFYNCKKLKKLTIKSKKLKTVGASAIKNINKKAAIKVPSAKVKAYKKLFKTKSGFRSTMKIKK